MSELYHYGVKGMKWGIRKDRDFNIKKGSTIKTVSVERDINFKNTPTYAYTKRDAKVYKGPYSEDLMYQKRDKFDGRIYEHKLKTKQDIKVASIKTQKKEFADYYKKNQDRIDNQMKPGFDSLMNTNYAILTGKKISYDKVKGNSDKMFSIFSTYMDAYMYTLNNDPASSKRFDLAKEYVDQLKGKSYSALIDANNKDSYYRAKAPVLILDGKDYVEDVGINSMSVNDIRRNAKYVSKVLRRTNNQGGYTNVIDELSK